MARRWQISQQQVFDWRRAARKALARATAAAEPSFVPVVSDLRPPAPKAAVSLGRSLGPLIEVKVSGGMLRIAPGTDEELLTAVLRAIRVSAS